MVGLGGFSLVILAAQSRSLFIPFITGEEIAWTDALVLEVELAVLDRWAVCDTSCDFVSSIVLAKFDFARCSCRLWINSNVSS